MDLDDHILHAIGTEDERKHKDPIEIRTDNELKSYKRQLKHHTMAPLLRRDIQRGYFTLNKLDGKGKDSILDPKTGRLDLERVQRGTY